MLDNGVVPTLLYNSLHKLDFEGDIQQVVLQIKHGVETNLEPIVPKQMITDKKRHTYQLSYDVDDQNSWMVLIVPKKTAQRMGTITISPNNARILLRSYCFPGVWKWNWI